MFQRRTPRTLLQNTREVFWPSMGWIRALKYLKIRMIRLSDTTHKIAAGLGIGGAISFTPLLGTHFLQAAAIAYVTRSNVLASCIGTFLGNPWTFPFMWWIGYAAGTWIFSWFGWSAQEGLPDHLTIETLWQYIQDNPWDIFLPWLVGGYVVGFLFWFPAYFSYYYLIKGARAAKKRMRVRRLKKVAEEITRCTDL